MNQIHGYGEPYEEKVIRIKMLMAAVLELAMHDLETGGFNDLAGAISWVTSHHDDDYPMSFRFVKSYLQLSQRRLEKIEEALRRGEQRREVLQRMSAVARKAKGIHVLCSMYGKREGDGAYVRRVKRRTQ